MRLERMLVVTASRRVQQRRRVTESAALRRGARVPAEPTSRSAGSVGSVGASRTPGRPADGLDAAATARSFVAGGGGAACGRACDPAAVNEGETSRAGAAAGRAPATAHVTSVGAAQQGAAPRGARSDGGGRRLTRGGGGRGVTGDGPRVVVGMNATRVARGCSMARRDAQEVLDDTLCSDPPGGRLAARYLWIHLGV